MFIMNLANMAVTAAEPKIARGLFHHVVGYKSATVHHIMNAVMVQLMMAGVNTAY